MSDFLIKVRNTLRDNQYQADREGRTTRMLYWAMRRPTRMYLAVVMAFCLGAWIF